MTRPWDTARVMRFWVRWEEPLDETQDYRPRTWPLPDCIIGYWCSGYRGDGSHAILCALVDGADEDAVKAEIQKHWSPATWSFCDPKPDDWTPGDRFPMKGKES